MSRIVLDANLAFRALAAGGAAIAERLDASDGREFHAPFFLLAELFEHKEQILRASMLAEQDIVDAFHQLIETITFVREATIPLGTWLEAHRLCEWNGNSPSKFSLTLL